MFQKQSKSWKQYGLLLLSMFFVSVLAHFYFIWKLPDGFVMKGVNDGLSQMLPFKQYIFENYSKGNFFYADDFGLGGGIYSQLAYYFTTNIFFLLISLLLFLVEAVSKYQVDLNTWVQLAIPMSIIKQTAIMFVAYIYFKKMNLSKKASYVGAIIYAVSPFFFRHEMYWDILTDGIFWLVLLLIGIERIIRNNSKTTFVIALALIFINNFYLAYINLLTGFIYILIRWILHCSNHELSIKKQMHHYIKGGLLGFGIGCFAFIPAAMGFLHNSRPPYKDSIPLVEIQDDILTNPRILWLPVFILFVLCIKKMYKNKTFQVFAWIAIVGTLLHFVPYVGSMFNGFSAPQNRWEAIVILGYSGAFAFAIDHFEYWKLSLLYRFSSILLLFMFIGSFVDPTFSFRRDWIIFLMTIVWIALVWYVLAKRITPTVIMFSVILFMIIFANVFEVNRLANDDLLPSRDTIQFMNSDQYNSKEQQHLVQFMKSHLKSDSNRIDWIVEDRTNTPIVQNYRGNSVYSSVLNGDILNMYQKHLQIDMEKESVSRYQSIGARTNLMALWQAQFYMRENVNQAVPYHYHLVKQSKNYNIYENQDLLPAFRVTNNLYSSKALDSKPIIAKEHAMLNGVITENGESSNVPQVPSLDIHQLSTVHSNWNGDTLKVQEDQGGVDFHVTPSKEVKDLYVQFFIEGIHKKKAFNLSVNEYTTLRKKSNSIYRTGYNHLTFAINKSSTIHIRLDKGNYRIKNIRVYEENYKTLTKALHENNGANIHWNNNHAIGNYTTTKPNEMLVTPIPYEQGWAAYINGKKAQIEKVNYAFIGVPLLKGENKIELKYEPPYWKVCLVISFVSILLFLVGVYRRRKMRKDS
ncbi:YfhO family protein [Rummeliibacillus sp. JY-2-4R]